MLKAIKTIFLAAVIAALAVVLEEALASVFAIFWNTELLSSYHTNINWFLFFAAIIEESLKLGAINFVIRKIFDAGGWMIVILSAILGVSWGLIEAGLSAIFEPGLLDLLMKGSRDAYTSLIFLVLIHALTAFLAGTLIATEAFSGQTKIPRILFFLVLIHLLFNFLITQQGDFTNWLVLLSFAITFLAGIAVLAANFRKLA